MNIALRDWRATLAGLLIAVLLVAILITRPAWGPREIGEAVAAIGAALLGLCTHFPFPTSAPAPAAPPPPPPPAP